MEEYLQYMKTLRSQMNDVEDQAAKISVEEQTHITTIQTLQNDLDSAKSEMKKLKEDIEQMINVKGQICSQILGKQRKIASLESDSSTLAQTQELIQQERAYLSSKLLEKSAYYAKVAEDITSKLQQQQDRVNSQAGGDRKENGSGTEARVDLLAKLEAAKVKLDEMVQRKSELLLGNNKLRQSLEQVKCRANDFKPQLLEMDISTLEEEQKVVVSDKAGETEYLQSLKNQFETLKGISHVIKCACGEEYKVAVGPMHDNVKFTSERCITAEKETEMF